MPLKADLNIDTALETGLTPAGWKRSHLFSFSEVSFIVYLMHACFFMSKTYEIHIIQKYSIYLKKPPIFIHVL